MGHRHLRCCYSLFVVHTALLMETFLVVQSKSSIQIVHLCFLQRSRAPSCKAQLTPFMLSTRCRACTSICRRRVPVAPAKLPQPNHHLGPANVHRCEQVPGNTLWEKIAHTLKYRQNHGLVHLQCPPCLEYVFLNDLCICAVRQATVTKLIFDCFKLMWDCSLLTLCIVLGFAGFTCVG